MMNTDQKFIIATHEMFYGVPHALRDYLINNKIEEVIFIGFPFMEHKKSTFAIYKKGKLHIEKHIDHKIFGIKGNIRDFFLTIYWIVKQKERYDVFVGIDVLNALSALALKKLGKVKKVVFYALDFVPVRFRNRFLNFLFHKIEEICVKNVDEVWNVSPKIAEGRSRYLDIDPLRYPQKVANSGIWIKKVKRFPLKRVKKHQLLYLGHLLEKQGVQKVLEAIPEIVRKIPDFKFVILGGGEYGDNLKKMARQFRIQNHVEFKGWITNRKIIDSTLGESAAAIVLYVPEIGGIDNYSYYADPTKIKEYLASGLPVILTNVPYSANEIGKRKCGIVVNYKKEEIVNAVVKLLSNENLLMKYKKNALEYAKEFDWGVIFSKVLG